ncbi:MAG: 30S ribosomal protein S18 [Chloroflexi bacterium]|nr:MAG: 30S ribosomal protein S18 [Chloroflexota bacterium]
MSSESPSGPRRSSYGDRDRRPSYGDRDRGERGERGGAGGRRPRRRVCSFCVEKVQKIDYKDVGRIRRYISERGKIDPRRKSGTCAKHQRMLTEALKRARFMALLPYTAEHVRSLMSPQARAMAGGPPPPKPDRPPYRPGEFRPAPRYGPPPAPAAMAPGAATPGAAVGTGAPAQAPTASATPATPAAPAAPAPRREETPAS